MYYVCMYGTLHRVAAQQTNTHIKIIKKITHRNT